MADTGWVSPTDSAQYHTVGQPWTNIAEGYSQNDTPAYCDNYEIRETDRLTYFDFDFSSIPAGSRIDGIEMRYDGYDEVNLTAHLYERQAKLHIGGVRMGDDKFIEAVMVHGSDQDIYRSFGGSTDKWGACIRLADIQNSDFGISLIFYHDGILGYTECYVDHVQMKIHYTESSPDLEEDTGWISPGTVAQYSGGSNWEFIDNIKLQNDTWARNNVLKEESTNRLAAENFSFGIPAGATIVGIEVRYDVWGNNAQNENKEQVVQLHKSGTAAGDNYASGGSVPASDTDTYLERGDWCDMWNTGYDYDDVTDSGFGVLYAVNNISTVANIYTYVDHIQIKITYIPLAEGYGHNVNEVPAANIASVNETLSANIATVNET